MRRDVNHYRHPIRIGDTCRALNHPAVGQGPLRELICGSTRFNDLRRGVPLMSSSLLSQRLKFLQREGVIERGRRGQAAGPSTI